MTNVTSVHIKFNRINLQTYGCYCLKCYEGIILFTTISNQELYHANQGCKIKLTVGTKKAFSNQNLTDQLNVWSYAKKKIDY